MAASLATELATELPPTLYQLVAFVVLPMAVLFAPMASAAVWLDIVELLRITARTQLPASLVTEYATLMLFQRALQHSALLVHYWEM